MDTPLLFIDENKKSSKSFKKIKICLFNKALIHQFILYFFYEIASYFQLETDWDFSVGVLFYILIIVLS
jgi:hypothetical protein